MNENRAVFAKKITGIDNHYFDLITQQKKNQENLNKYLNNYKIDLNSNYFYFGEKSNSLANGFGYLCSSLLANHPIVLNAIWENGFPIKFTAINLYRGIHSTSEIPSLEIKKINSNHRILIDYKGLIVGEHNGKEFEGGVFRVWNDGNYFMGSYKNGKRTEGYAFFDNGDTYLGLFDDTGKFNGIGKYNWKDGSMYQGEWSNNERNGYGIFTEMSGRTEEGLWQNNIFVKTKETIENENREAEEQRISQEKIKQEEARKQKNSQEKYDAFIFGLVLQGLNNSLSDNSTNTITNHKTNNGPNFECDFCHQASYNKDLPSSRGCTNSKMCCGSTDHSWRRMKY